MCLVKVYITSFDSQFSDATWHRLVNEMPDSAQVKILSFKRWQDRHAALLGRLLLIHALMEEGYSANVLEALRYTEYNRPYLPLPVDFNISHSGNYVICGISTYGRVGIDIERVNPITVTDFRSVFSQAEWQEICESPEPLPQFYHYWALKESVIKADGRGLSIPLQDLNVNGFKAFLHNTWWYLQELDVHKEYKCFLATNHVSEVTVSYLSYS